MPVKSANSRSIRPPTQALTTLCRVSSYPTLPTVRMERASRRRSTGVVATPASRRARTLSATSGPSPAAGSAPAGSSPTRSRFIPHTGQRLSGSALPTSPHSGIVQRYHARCAGALTAAGAGAGPASAAAGGVPGTSLPAYFGTSFMPQMSQLPGPGLRTCGCIVRVQYSTAGPAGAVAAGGAPAAPMRPAVVAMRQVAHTANTPSAASTSPQRHRRRRSALGVASVGFLLMGGCPPGDRPAAAPRGRARGRSPAEGRKGLFPGPPARAASSARSRASGANCR